MSKMRKTTICSKCANAGVPCLIIKYLSGGVGEKISYLNVKNAQNKHLVIMRKCRGSIFNYKTHIHEGLDVFLCTKC